MAITPLPSHAADRPEIVDPALRAPTPEQVISWLVRVAAELARAPFTLYRVRKVLQALGRLPEQIEALTIALDRTTQTLETTLARMDGRLEQVQGTFGSVDGRVEHLDESVSELADTITSLIGAIPGARRSLRSSR